MTTRRYLSWIGLCVAMIAFAGFAWAQEDTPKAKSLEGKAAPDLQLGTLDGKQFKLSGLKGKVVLMDYWATWCPPCRKSLPHINELSQDKSLTDKGLMVFAINDKEAKAKVQDFVKQNNYKFNVPLDPQGKFGQAYLVEGIPTTVIVGRDGTVKKVFVGFGEGSENQIKAAIEDALKETA
jgi:thiol-disulfide isomerase/thioredoxin